MELCYVWWGSAECGRLVGECGVWVMGDGCRRRVSVFGYLVSGVGVGVGGVGVCVLPFWMDLESTARVMMDVWRARMEVVRWFASSFLIPSFLV